MRQRDRYPRLQAPNDFKKLILNTPVHNNDSGTTRQKNFKRRHLDHRFSRILHDRKSVAAPCPRELLAFVITVIYHDNMVRTQISFDEDIYNRAKSIAKQQGISLSELCRRGLAALLAKEPTQKSWMAYVGRLQGRKEDSESVDAVVHDREAP